VFDISKPEGGYIMINITEQAKREIEGFYDDNELVYTCGYKNSHSCSRCGNCVREYYNAKERMRNAAQD